MLLLAIFSLALHFRSSHAQLDANGISLAEKVLAIEQLMLTPGTIDFQVAPCDFVLNGPPNSSPDISGDQVCFSESGFSWSCKTDCCLEQLHENRISCFVLCLLAKFADRLNRLLLNG